MGISKKVTVLALVVSMLAVSWAEAVSAHVVVKPSDAKTGAYQTFTVSVPTEKNNPTVGVKLDVPEGVSSVTPTLKPGWTIEIDKQGTDDDAVVTAITWTGGEIEVGYRDEFTFSAKTPDQPTDLQWKAYQTYQDGTVVSWDQQPSAEDKEGGTTGPFSVTKVAADSDQDKALKSADSKAAAAQSAADRALYVGIGGIILGLIALISLAVRRTKV